ncbi:hypothetical protein F4780DRAFT_729078, partial [Xylariomycetidae sp. FL0641]
MQPLLFQLICFCDVLQVSGSRQIQAPTVTNESNRAKRVKSVWPVTLVRRLQTRRVKSRSSHRSHACSSAVHTQIFQNTYAQIADLDP